MTKLLSFVRLDFITVKPYFTIKNLLIYAVVVLFLAAMSGGISSGMSVGVMMGVMFISYPFAVGEKSNMDALYSTLAIDRKTVVAGRYLFALVLNALVIALSFAVACVGLFIGESAGFDAWESLLTAGVLIAIIVAIQSFQLPLFFKFGYTKAKFFSMVPFYAIMIGFLVFTSVARDLTPIATAIANVNATGLAALTVAALIIAVFVSFRLSLSFYKKREF